MTEGVYFSFVEQALHYFTRPHEHVASEPVQVDAAWRGGQMPSLEQMAYRLSAGEIEEIMGAVRSAAALNKGTRSLTAADFPLPTLEQQIRRWREVLAHGLGFQVIRGVPVDRWTQEEAELFFWCFGLHLGRPGEQNPEGHLLGHVIDTGEARQDASARLYKTSANIDYHCDAADVVGLLCLKKAKEGGHSRIASSVTVFNELLNRRPDLAARLFEPMQLDIRDREANAQGSTLPIQPCCYADGMLRTFYHADYFRSVVRHDDIESLDATEQALLNTYDEIALEPDIYLDMDLEPGDIQLLSNHTVVHARTDYLDHEDPAERRHLLRLWLSLEHVET
ncbi:MAG: TauD/TfdA family dioxygenase [Pseudomonadota bacterium]